MCWSELDSSGISVLACYEIRSQVLSISFSDTKSVWSAGRFLPSYSSRPSEKERSKRKKKSKDPIFVPNFVRKQNLGTTGDPCYTSTTASSCTDGLSEQEDCLLAFGHAELWDLLPPGQILCMFCPDVNSESCNCVTPKIIIHVQISVGDKWILGESSQNCKHFFLGGGLSQVMLGFSMELRTVPAPIVLSSIKLEDFE